jgi:hypothetical protein
MKNTHRRIVSRAVTLTLVIALAVQTGFIIAANADETAVGSKENWEDVSSAFTKQIGLDDVDPNYPFLRRCEGLIVTPTGDIVMQTTNKGICVSRDQGATWSVVADNKIVGRCEDAFGFSLSYPYDGRMAFFCYDGDGKTSGGISLDDAKTWKPFSQIQRGVELGDVDWNTPDPQAMIGLTHEPFYSVLSHDGGKNWQRIDNAETGANSGPDDADYCLGLVDAKTLIRSNAQKQGGIIELSKDAGQTWAQVANYHVLGRRPVHYGNNVYWTTAKGVIVSRNGKDWTLTGPGAEGSYYGPYFGANEKEFVVVTDQNFLKTEDGGKSWKPVAKFYMPADIFHGNSQYCMFGWDAKHNILYSSGLGSAVYRLKL